ALDLVDGPAALLLGTLASHGQNPRYVTGSKFAAFKKSFSGRGKSDLKDSYIITEFARCLRRQTVPVPAPLCGPCSGMADSMRRSTTPERRPPARFRQLDQTH
ncbi:transposase, partial [Streptomyces sp. NPDC058424]|uniref:IS110 family transposase n=1 Tax=Streptomyces sp. NPDC058424 TaxID=3346491 RepID=UPI00364C108D